MICIYFAYNYNQKNNYFYEGKIYGTYWKISSKEFINQQYIDEIENILNKIDLIASNYKQNSEVNKLNFYDTDKEFFLSNDLYEIFKLAFEVSDKTNGVYDITVGSVVNNLGFGPNLFLDNQYVFEPYSLKFSIDDRNKSITKYKEFVFDLSSIAKGYAVDAISNYLLANNFNNYLIDIGGEIAANGSSKTGAWIIGIQDPQSLQKKVSFEVPRSDNFIGVATSGDYLNFKYIDGELVSHSIDPRIIKSKDNNILSVTVLDETSVARADAFATAFNVMYLDESVEVSESFDIKIKIIYVSDGLISYFESKSWQNMKYE